MKNTRYFLAYLGLAILILVLLVLNLCIGSVNVW